ncbi:hypothetical protein HMPREF9554_02091 [Treponema phagedenis F0421]|nr:hypothetical protein HMPREF9554_02091 [Treponema phagedenis F0421]
MQVYRFVIKSIIFFNTSYPKRKKFYKKEFDTAHGRSVNNLSPLRQRVLKLQF